MKAKDTVIKLKAVPKRIFENRPDTIHTKSCYLAGWNDGTEAQAEISFKAGEEKARREATIAMNELVNKVSRKQYQVGINKVVEWIDDTDIMVMLSPKKRREWQTKLKEWGIRQDVPDT